MKNICANKNKKNMLNSQTWGHIQSLSYDWFKGQKNIMLDNLNLDHIAINVKENMDEAYNYFLNND